MAQEGFYEDSEKNTQVKKRIGQTPYKVSNERNHPKLGEKHSDWKEKSVFDGPLSKQEISDDHIGALMEQEEDKKFARDNFYVEEYDESEDQDLEKAA